ncbi:MAG: hypothetical protein V1928_02535 [Parcubacteria group bacterium]
MPGRFQPNFEKPSNHFEDVQDELDKLRRKNNKRAEEEALLSKKEAEEYVEKNIRHDETNRDEVEEYLKANSALGSFEIEELIDSVIRKRRR